MIDLATWQCIRDRRNNKQLSLLHRRILDYGELKRQWGYGHIEIRKRKCHLSVCRMLYGKSPYHTSYYGHYVNIRHEKKRVYLGFSIRNALSHVCNKKSALDTHILMYHDWFS